MKYTLIILSFLFSVVASAAVEFEGSDWHFGESKEITITKVGLASDETGLTRVVLNTPDMSRQIKFTGEHLNMGLSLIPLQGKCIKVIPGKKFQSVNLILTCE